MSKKKFSFRKLLWTMVLFLLLLVGAGAGLTYVYEDDLKAYVIAKIDEQIEANIEVEKINLNLWRNFPNASLQFKNIRIGGSIKNATKPLLKCQNIYLQFNLKELIQRNFILRKVSLVDGEINILYDENGHANYQIGKEHSDSSDFFLSIKDFKLKKIQFLYQNPKEKQEIGLHISNLKLPLSLQKDLIDFRISGALMIDHFLLQNQNLIENKSLALNCALKYNYKAQRFDFQPSNIDFQNIPLDISGALDFGQKPYHSSLKIASQEVDLEKVLSLMSAYVSYPIKEYKAHGKLKFSFIMNGDFSSNNAAPMHAEFSINNASVYEPRSGLHFNNLQFIGTYDNGKTRSLKSSYFQIKNLKTICELGPIKGQLMLKNFQNAHLNLMADMDMNLLKAKEFMKLESLDVLQGNAQTQFQLHGEIPNLINAPDWTKLRYNLESELENVSFKLKAQKVQYENISAQMKLSKNTISFKNLKLTTAKSNIQGSASISNYLSIINPLDARPVEINASLRGDYMSWNLLQKIIEYESSSTSSTQYLMNIQFNVNQFDYDNLVLKQAKGNFHFWDNRWKINSYSFKSMEGQVEGDLEYKPLDNGGRLQFINRLHQVNIQTLFKSFNNFDQNVLTYINIKGLANANLSGSLLFDKDMNYLLPSLKLNSFVEVSNGELNDLKVLNALSDYTRIDDFSHVIFSKFSNTLSIADEKIHIPKMHIESNKMNMDVFGTHTFNNEYEYHLNILLAEVLGKKVQKTEENEFGIIQDDGYGKTRLFLNIKGSGEDFDVSYDRKEMSQKLKSDAKKEGEELKSALKEEFTNSQRDSLRRAKKQQKQIEKQNLKTQESGKFIIQWDDDTTDTDF